jgi:hypothetical protein
MDVALKINDVATEALGNAMYRFTFGIIGDGRFGAEGQGLATGIGVLWKNTYLILTADHAIRGTPYERVYFLLPDEALQLADSDITSGLKSVGVRKRFELEKPEMICADNDDLAAFVLEGQVQETGQNHFYRLDENHATPVAAEQVGVLGYPGETRLPVGANYMATPYLAFGELGQAPSELFDDKESRVSISYPTTLTVDPHGLSGSGLWIPTDMGGVVWNPGIALIGLVTNHVSGHQILVGYKVEKLIEFLRANDNRMFKG